MKLHRTNGSALRVLGFSAGLAVLLAGGTACNRQSATAAAPQTRSAPSLLLAKSGGREIRASIADALGCSIEGLRDSGAIVKFGGHKVRVEKERLLLNGRQVAAISTGAKVVEIVSTGDTVTVTVDGEKIVEKSL
jgi:hypothetical protein